MLSAATTKIYIPIFRSKEVNTFLLYLSTQICFPIGLERVTCHGSKLTNSLGQTTTRTFVSHVIGSCTLKPRQMASRKSFFADMAAKRFQTRIEEEWKYNKTLNEWPHGNSEFCFPSTLNVPFGEH